VLPRCYLPLLVRKSSSCVACARTVRQTHSGARDACASRSDDLSCERWLVTPDVRRAAPAVPDKCQVREEST
jgi:hypothetical protein